jgi:hypothetical protein
MMGPADQPPAAIDVSFNGDVVAAVLNSIVAADGKLFDAGVVAESRDHGHRIGS